MTIPGTVLIASGSTRPLYGDDANPGVLPHVPGVEQPNGKSLTLYPYLITVRNGSNNIVLGAESFEAVQDWRSAGLPPGIAYGVMKFVETVSATPYSGANGHFEEVPL